MLSRRNLKAENLGVLNKHCLFGTGVALDLGDSLTANSNEAGHPASDANDEDTGTFWEASQGP